METITVEELIAALQKLDSKAVAISYTEIANRNTYRLDLDVQLSEELEHELGMDAWIQKVRDRYEGP